VLDFKRQKLGASGSLSRGSVAVQWAFLLRGFLLAQHAIEHAMMPTAYWTYTKLGDIAVIASSAWRVQRRLLPGGPTLKAHWNADARGILPHLTNLLMRQLA
jgi:hypothetical protein